MASPVHITYNGVAGQPIRGGFYAPVVAPGVLSGAVTMAPMVASGLISFGGTVGGGVVNNVWSPQKDGAGFITAAGVAELPLNEWCEVNLSSIQSLSNKLAANGYPYNYDFGNGRLTSSFIAWCGGALAHDKFYMMANGGHRDSSYNGNHYLDILRMGGDDTWQIEGMPSNPFDPLYPWSNDYKFVGNTFSTYTPRLNDSVNNILPDGMPTSQHTYQGVYYNPNDNTIVRGGFQDKWVWNLTTKTWARSKYKIGGIAGDYPALYTAYHAPSATAFGNFSGSETSFEKVVDGNTNIVGVGFPTGAIKSGYSQCVVGNILQIFSQYPGYQGISGERWGEFNMATQTWTSGAVGGVVYTWNYSSEMMINCYVPDWNKTLRGGNYGNSGWWVFNNATKNNEAYVPVGKPPSTNLMADKIFYYTLWKTVIAIVGDTLNSNAVKVMRTG